MFDSLYAQIELVFMVLPVAAVFRAAIGEDSQKRNVMFLEEGKYAVVQQISGNKGIFSVVELGHRHFGVGIDEGLLVNPSDTFQITHIEGVLKAQVARVFRLDLAESLLLILCFLQCRELFFREDEVVLGNLCLKGLEPFLERLQVMALLHTPDTGRRNKYALISQFVGNAKLSPSRLLNSYPMYPVFYVYGYPVLGTRLASGEFLQGQFAASIIKLFEPVIAVP
jgi:hypothetical protein